MKTTTYLEEQPIDLTGYTLILPSVSVGNVGQLAVDLLLHNLPCRLVGAFSHPSVRAVVGSLDNRLMTAMQAYVCDAKKLVILQLRSPVSPHGRLSLVADLVTWWTERGLTSVIQLASSHAVARPDPAAPRLCRLTSSSTGSDPLLESLAPPQPSEPGSTTAALAGAGFVRDLYAECERRGVAYTCLLRHTYEGNNIPEARELCDCLDSWQGLLEPVQQELEQPGPLGRWSRPPTWSHLFGGGVGGGLF